MASHRGPQAVPAVDVPDARAVFLRVRALLSDKFEVETREVVPSSRLVVDLFVDPLDLEYFALALEEEFGIDISAAEAAQWVTVLDGVESVLDGYRGR